MSDATEIKYLFIRRPIFAAVISIVIVLLGAFALYTLPINRYPPITPPSVQVSAPRSTSISVEIFSRPVLSIFTSTARSAATPWKLRPMPFERFAIITRAAAPPRCS